MKKVSFLMVAGALLFSALPVVSQNTPMTLNGGYQGANWTYNNKTVGTGFYDGTINGVQVGPAAPGGPNGPGGLGMICDDFKDPAYKGQTWTATGINASSLNSSNIGQTLFGATLGLAGYTEVAYLVNQMFTTNPSSTIQAAYSEAIWALTGGVSYNSISSQAKSFYNTAITTFKSGKLSLSQFANLWIYTPNVKGSAQEMWGMVAVPEGGTALAYLLFAAISCFGAIRVRDRRSTSAGRTSV